MNPLIVVLPVCRPDLHIALQWLRWARVIQTPATMPYTLVVFAAKSVDEPNLQRLRDEVAGIGQLEVNPELYERHDLGYAAMANHMLRSALEMTERLFPGHPTLWCEPDCIPVRLNWAHEIALEYENAHLPFMGDFHAPGAIPHMSGNAVYSPDWREWAPSLAMLPGPRPEQGWDTQCAHETLPLSHRSCRIQQTWIVPMPRFTEANIGMIHPQTSLFHRCKDGSLIDVLAARRGVPAIPLDPPVCRPAPIYAVARQVEPTLHDDKGPRVHGLIVSCKRDVDMLAYLLRSIWMHARGFAGFTLMVPVKDVHHFRNIPSCVTLTTFDEVPGKGFLHHMIQKCRADEACPDADFIVHFDSDLLVWRDMRPEDFVKDGKCLLVREDYKLIAPRNPNRLIWRDCVERATGIVARYDVMVRHANVYPSALYRHMRNIVEAHTGRGFDEYVLSCENGWPQSFAEFPTLGNVGLTYMADSFNVVDYDHETDSLECGVVGRGHQYIYKPERDAVVEGWSHAGLAKYKTDWDKFMFGNLPKFYVK